MPKKRWSTRLAPGRDHSGTAGEIKSERAGEIKSVHLGDIVGIRSQRFAGFAVELQGSTDLLKRGAHRLDVRGVDDML
jgi:hypothetical protein